MRSQGQGLGVGGLRTGQRLQQGQHPRRLPQRQLGLGREAACRRAVGCQLHGLVQQLLGLAGCLCPQFRHAGRLQEQHIVRRPAQQALEAVAGGGQVTLLQRHLAFGLQGARMARQTLPHGLQLAGRARQILLRQGQCHQRGMGLGMCRLHHQRLAPGGGQRGRRGALAQQQVPLQHPGIGHAGLVLHQGLHLGQRAGQVARQGRQAGLQQQRRRMTGHGLQRLGQAGAGVIELLQAGLGLGQQGLQLRLRQRLDQLVAAMPRDQQRGPVGRQQRLRQRRHHPVGGQSECQRALQFDHRIGRPAGRQQQLAQQQAGIGLVRQVLQQGLDDDQRPVGVLPRHHGAGIVQPLRRAAAAAGQARDHHHGEDEHRRYAVAPSLAGQRRRAPQKPQRRMHRHRHHRECPAAPPDAQRNCTRLPTARIAPSPSAAPKRLASFSATFSRGV